jgi:hypothetical protein
MSLKISFKQPNKYSQYSPECRILTLEFKKIPEGPNFSIQYRLVQYLSILYITLYNNLLLFSPLSHVISMLTVLLFYVSVRHDLTAQFKYEHSVTSWWIQLREWVLNVPTQVWCTPQWIFHDRKVKYVCRFFSYQLLLYYTTHSALGFFDGALK